jgi:hypothetical protein
MLSSAGFPDVLDRPRIHRRPSPLPLNRCQIAKELDLKSPLETNQPVSVKFQPGDMPPARAAAE